MLYPARDDVLSGRYEIRELLGEGGMGRVYLAFDRKASAEVAIKFVRSEGEVSASLLRRFDREIRTLRKLSHPGILAYIDHGREGPMQYLVVELLRGHSLHEVLPEFRGQPEKVALLGSRLARALAAAHAQGVVHRDLKPANIHLSDSGEPRILDFGLALWDRPEGADPTKLTTIEKLTVTGDLLGTVAYMSLEQLSLEAVDRRTDIFSLGVVLYELAAGRRPYEGGTLQKFQEALAAGDPAPVHAGWGAEAGSSGPALDAVLRAALRPRPEERLQSMQDFELALERILERGTLLPRGASAAILVPPRSLVQSRKNPTFVGRVAELAHADLILRKTESSGGSLMIVEGPGGAGLSRVGDEIVRTAHRRGWLALPGSANPRAGGEAKTPAAEWLDRASLLFPEEASVREARVADGTPGGPSLRETLRTLRTLAARVPVLAVVDEAQSAEPDSFTILAEEIPYLECSRLTVVLLTRTDAIRGETRLASFRTAASREETVRLRLAPLGVEDLRRIAEESYPGAEFGGPFLERLVARSGGLPGHALDLLRWVEEQGHFRRDGPEWTFEEPPDLPHPPRVAAQLRERLAELQVEEMETLEAAAVLDGPFGPSRIARMMGLAPEAAAARLTTIELRYGLLQSAGAGSVSGGSHADGRLWSFDQPLTREILEGLVPLERLVRWHLAAARELERDLADLDLAFSGDADGGTPRADPSAHEGAARHFLAAGREGEALPHVLSAARLYRERFDAAGAIPWLERAIRILERTFEGATDADRPLLRAQLAEAQFDLGESLQLAARYVEAIEQLDRVRVLATEVGRADLLARTLLAMARSLIARGDFLQAQRRARDAARVARRESLQAEEALALAIEAHAGSRLGDTEGIEETFLEAEKTLLAMDRRDEAAEVQFRLANHYLRLQRFEEAEKSYSQAAGMVSQTTNPRLHAAIQNGIAGVLLGRGRPGEALPRFQAAAATFEAMGSRRELAASLHNVSHCLHYLGDLRRAEATYRSVSELRIEGGDLAGLAAARLNRATVLLDMGRLEEALAEGAEALAMRRQAEDLSELPLFLNPVGQIELQFGRTERARMLFLEVIQRHPAMTSEVVQAEIGLAQAEWLAGRIDAARAAFERLARQLDRQQNAIEIVILRYLALRFLLEHGGEPEAVEVVAESFPGDELSGVTEEIRLVHAVGRSLLARRDGDLASARILLLQARGSAEVLEMPEWLWRIDRLSADLEPEGTEARRQAICRAAGTVEERARLLRDEELRRAYLAHRERAETLALRDRG